MPSSATAIPGTGAILVVPPQADIAERTAAWLLAGHRARLPDLSKLTLLIPSSTALPALRRQLGAQAGGALLGPNILTLPQFAAERGDAPPPLPATECRLALVDALRKYRNLFPGQDPWQIAEALFLLFEELTLHAAKRDTDEASFTSRLASAYGARPLAALSREAQIVHRLWQAFDADTDGRSPAATYRRNLHSAFSQLRADEDLGVAGFDEFTHTEQVLLAGAIASGRARLLLHGRHSGRDGAALQSLLAAVGGAVDEADAAGDARTRLLDAALSPRSDVLTPDDPGLRITLADGPEHEARCVDLAVRSALLDDCRDIAVVTEDRRLARRLRALLERAGVALRDEGGWALSTSAAAAALNAWLDAFQSRFQFRPLLDLLKSGFIDADPLALRELERDLIYRKEIESGLDRYRRATTLPALGDLLDRLADAARALPTSTQTLAGHQWAGALETSLERLGLLQRWQTDDAGQRLIDTLREVGAALGARPQKLDWSEFRTLLGRTIERATFVPENAMARSRVRLLTLEQTRLLSCDAVIVAGATRAQLPGPPAGEPFFNQSVRAELGLPTLAQRHALALARLRNLLQAAPRVHITYAPENPGEDAQLCPWLEAVEARARAADRDLRDHDLAARAGTAMVEIAAAAAAPPSRRTRPAPVTPMSRLPSAWSASTHQTLIDCPYRFFAQACLGLRAEQAPDEDPDRSDYGQRVHRILQAFTEPVDDLPPPFTEAVTPGNRVQAQARLEDLADAVFGRDLRERVLAHVWLTEFRASIPTLLDWLETREASAVRAEQKLSRAFGERWTLTGTADRLEQIDDEHLALVDYKTGNLPRGKDIAAGETVQLPHYALLDERITRAEYLPLKDEQRPLAIENEELGELRDAVGDRLHRLIEAIAAGRRLPAFGDEETCSRCDAHGLCRRKDWHEDEEPSAEVITLPRSVTARKHSR